MMKHPLSEFKNNRLLVSPSVLACNFACLADELKAAEEATGVKLDFIEVGSASASEQFNLMVAGGDMTDLIPVIEY